MKRTYSIEKLANGIIIIFLHCSFGIIPLMSISSQEELREFISLLSNCIEEVEIPDSIKKAFNNNGDESKC